LYEKLRNTGVQPGQYMMTRHSRHNAQKQESFVEPFSAQNRGENAASTYIQHSASVSEPQTKENYPDVQDSHACASNDYSSQAVFNRDQGREVISPGLGCENNHQTEAQVNTPCDIEMSLGTHPNVYKSSPSSHANTATRKNPVMVKCPLCEIKMQRTAIARHEQSRKHQKEVARLEGHPVSHRTHCESCGQSLFAQNWDRHSQSKKHLDSIREGIQRAWPKSRESD